MSFRTGLEGTTNAGLFWYSLCHNENSCEELHESFVSALLCSLRFEPVSLLLTRWSVWPTDHDLIVTAEFCRASYHHPARCSRSRPHERAHVHRGAKPLRNRAPGDDASPRRIAAQRELQQPVHLHPGK